MESRPHRSPPKTANALPSSSSGYETRCPPEEGSAAGPDDHSTLHGPRATNRSSPRSPVAAQPQNTQPESGSRRSTATRSTGAGTRARRCLRARRLLLLDLPMALSFFGAARPPGFEDRPWALVAPGHHAVGQEVDRRPSFRAEAQVLRSGGYSVRSGTTPPVCQASSRATLGLLHPGPNRRPRSSACARQCSRSAPGFGGALGRTARTTSAISSASSTLLSPPPSSPSAAVTSIWLRAVFRSRPASRATAR